MAIIVTEQSSRFVEPRTRVLEIGEVIPLRTWHPRPFASPSMSKTLLVSVVNPDSIRIVEQHEGYFRGSNGGLFGLVRQKDEVAPSIDSIFNGGNLFDWIIGRKLSLEWIPEPVIKPKIPFRHGYKPYLN